LYIKTQLAKSKHISQLSYGTDDSFVGICLKQGTDIYAISPW